MMRRRLTGLAAVAALLSSCGGGGGGGGGGSSGGGSTATGTTSVTPTPTPTTATTSSSCSLRARQDWVAAQLREWYLFPDTLPASLDPTPYTTVTDYLDALTATARSQRKDRYFTYLTSIADENAFYASGSSAGFGFRLGYDSTAQRVFAIESFENTPALAAGIDRGTEITAIGTSASNLQTVTSLFQSGGAAAVSNALGPNTAGLTRVLRVVTAGVTRDVTVSKSDYELTPVSSRYGAKIIDDGGIKVGYVNLRTFISTADPALRSAFAQFKAAGVTNVVVDLRYNGGGLISIADLFSDLLGAARSTSQVVDYTVFRPEKSSNNSTRFYQRQDQAIAPVKIAFIGTGGTASASELVINAAIPYFHANAALIGTNTFGKPVGQIALDQPACDDRLRVIALATQNSARQGDYYDGLASKVEASCQAGDDISFPLGDAREASVRSAINFLQGKTCTPISTSTASASAAVGGRRIMLSPDTPSAAQRETPGLF